MTLADYLAKHDMTDAAFAALVKVNQSTVNRIRRGQKPSPAVIEAIAVATKGAVQPNDFFRCQGDKLAVVRHRSGREKIPSHELPGKLPTPA